jgi:Tol biopolymer transport system component
VSDESNGEYNLYQIAGKAKTQLTSFPESIKRPFVAADGTKMAFEKGLPALYLRCQWKENRAA